MINIWKSMKPWMMQGHSFQNRPVVAGLSIMWLSRQAIPPRPSFLIFNYLQAAHMPKEQSHLIARLLIKMMRTEHLATLPMGIVALDFPATGPVHTALISSRKTRVLLFCDYYLNTFKVPMTHTCFCNKGAPLTPLSVSMEFSSVSYF